MERGSWFAGKTFDLTFFHIPVWLCWLIVFLLPAVWLQTEIPVWVWVTTVLLVDVGHVWSSIYRTYLDPVARDRHRILLRVTPLICFAVCIGLAFHSEQLFWRVLAYVAVFHFIKQQVGIGALYRYRHASVHDLPRAETVWLGKLDKWALYVGAGFPVIYWHLTPDKGISWFIPGDFLNLTSVVSAIQSIPGGGLWIQAGIGAFYVVWFGILVVWGWSHLRVCRAHRVPFPLGKALWVIGTWVNWYLGIVYFDSDLAFTITNVIAHGVPYYGLIGLYAHRKLRDHGYGIQPRLPSGRWARALFYAFFLMPILFLATFEEYLWNFLLYREYGAFFEALWRYPMAMVDSPGPRAFWMAVLALPQVVHYILDGFIWKFNSRNPDLKKYILPSQ